MRQILISAIQTAFSGLNLAVPDTIVIERPADMTHGDFSTNIALSMAKELKMNPVALAVQIVDAMKGKDMNGGVPGIEKIEVAGPGFINFYQTSGAIKNAITDCLSNDNYGKGELYVGKKLAYEYTDPNPFKVFHIGHLMANTIGESLSRLGEYQGGEVKRFCYQGDVGRHVALTLWGLRFMEVPFPEESASLLDKVTFLGQAYAKGATTYKTLSDEEKSAVEKGSHSVAFQKADSEMRDINKHIYERSHPELIAIYDKGREWSLEYFEGLYKILDTTFDKYFFESQVSGPGIEIVKANTDPEGQKIFKESEGAVVFPGEEYGLHTRVFITREGLPTYEGKEIGLAKVKYAEYQYDKGITVTANEQDDYFKVILKVTQLLFPEIGEKASHISHGIMRLPTGKMSSRTGDVISAQWMIDEMSALALERMKERDIESGECAHIAEQIAIAAIKYTILRQASGKDVIFDAEKSLSFEGDSGPYLQYSVVRANSILEKARTAGINATTDIQWSPELDAGTLNWSGGKIERLMIRFPEIVAYAAEENAPHTVANYLMELAGEFNSFYASTQIVNTEDKFAPYKVALVQSFSKIVNKGLWLLGIKVPARM